MSTFIVAMAGKNPEVLSRAKAFERNFEVSPTVILVTYQGSPENVADLVGLGRVNRAEGASGIVVEFTGYRRYFGYHSTDLWDWLKEVGQ